MMSIPEGFKTLLANLVLGSSIHKKHNQEHKMSCNAAGLSVVNVYRPQLAKFYDI
jgi:hypothetical protein